MPDWIGKRTVVVVTACMNADGTPDFALNEVEVSQEEYENGVHYLLADDRVADAGYDEPYVHFDEFEMPAFLHPAVRRHLNLPDAIVNQAHSRGGI